MNYGEIKDKVEDISSRPDAVNFIAYAVNLAMRRIEREYSLNYMRKTITSLTITTGDRDVVAPTDLKAPVYFYIVVNDSKALLTKVDDEDIDFFNKDETPSNSVPEKYAVRGTNLVLDVPPESGYSNQFSYYAFSADLTADGDSNWLTNYGYDALILATLVEVAHYVKDDAAIELNEALFQRAIASLCIADAKLKMQRTMERV
jgi:hypothetical protein